MNADQRKDVTRIGVPEPEETPLPDLPDDPRRVRDLAMIGQRALRMLAKIDAHQEAVQAAADAATAAEKVAKRRAVPTPAQIQKVAHRLAQVDVSLTAVHHLAWASSADSNVEPEHAFALIQETVRGAVQAIDACIELLGERTYGHSFPDPMRER
jgi:hypothetical protein